MGINVRGFRGLSMYREHFYTYKFNTACLKGYSAKIKSAKTFLKVFPQKFIPAKYTRYMVFTSIEQASDKSSY